MTLQVNILCTGEVDAQVLSYISEGLARELEAEVHLLAKLPVPAGAYDLKRDQYSSTKILKTLCPKRSLPCTVTLIVTEVDLYVPRLNFVFGEAHPISGCCIISLARLYFSFEGRPVEKDLAKERALKEAIHEIGHVLGLNHCIRPECVMFFSNSILDTDGKSHSFCGDCLSEI